MKKIFLNLGLQPMANNFAIKSKNKQKFYNLKIKFDNKNYLTSISKIIPSKNIYNSHYPYLSSMSKTMQVSFKNLAKKIKNKYKPKNIIEIGSNDGSFIKYFNKKNALCVEPCSNLAKLTRNKGYKTFNNFWDYSLIKKIKKIIPNVDFIYSANTISHINNLNTTFDCIKKILSKNGVAVIEDPSLLESFKKNIYDQFYNEHVYVFSLISLKKILTKYNLEIFDIDRLSTHGGSLRYYIKHNKNNKLKINKKVFIQEKKEIKFGLNKFKTYIKFAERVFDSKKKLVDIFNKIKKNKKRIIGYGATAKSATVLNFCKINNKHIDYFLDTTPYKINKYTPGSNILIKKYERKLSTEDCEYAFLGAWNFKKEIFLKEKDFLRKGGKFITHVPFPGIIGKKFKNKL
jgi:methylation protein EvaC